jgi:hypothetical protein
MAHNEPEAPARWHFGQRGGLLGPVGDRLCLFAGALVSACRVLDIGLLCPIEKPAACSRSSADTVFSPSPAFATTSFTRKKLAIVFRDRSDCNLVSLFGRDQFHGGGMDNRDEEGLSDPATGKFVRCDAPNYIRTPRGRDTTPPDAGSAIRVDRAAGDLHSCRWGSLRQGAAAATLRGPIRLSHFLSSSGFFSSPRPPSCALCTCDPSSECPSVVRCPLSRVVGRRRDPLRIY